METLESLKILDLSDQETKIYSICLEKGEANLADICQAANIPRSTTKYILEKLKKKGLLNIVLKGKSQSYFALPPRNIVTVLKSQKEKIDEQIDEVRNILPQLNQIYGSTKNKPGVRYFSGEEIRLIYEEILDSPISETLFIGSMAKTAEVVGLRYLKNWMKRRAALGIKTRAIRIREGEIKDDPVINTRTKNYLRSYRIAPENFKSPMHIIIYGNNVASISTSQENFGFVITSKEYAETMKNMFREVWKNSKEI
jgi:sugar-specific transcriptional regulator TrmB